MQRVVNARRLFAAALVLVSTLAEAQSWKPPAESERCPSKWGAGDERGAANHMKPAAVLNAARLIRTTSSSLAEVALASGFVDQSHMTRAFRRGLGITPAAYRRRHA